ncbi:uncharacterized protein LOC128249820 isoform X1 [Octopus bimaculoides]|uniref:uncharacterized protein LOC128249820 isoform X1 n=1 Tax=Octopus bimaculoides TaxID=37653 RepID=UPI0022E2F876|nr:uncharacterized protein LOC128249820 isoform X1 [Octopus bimaculoides]
MIVFAFIFFLISGVATKEDCNALAQKICPHSFDVFSGKSWDQRFCSKQKLFFSCFHGKNDRCMKYFSILSYLLCEIGMKKGNPLGQPQRRSLNRCKNQGKVSDGNKVGEQKRSPRIHTSNTASKNGRPSDDPPSGSDNRNEMMSQTLYFATFLIILL